MRSIGLCSLLASPWTIIKGFVHVWYNNDCNSKYWAGVIAKLDPCERQGIQLALWLQNDLPRSRPPRNVNPWSTASAPFGRVKCTRMAFKAVRVKSLLGRILVAPHCKRGSDGIVQSDRNYDHVVGDFFFYSRLFGEKRISTTINQMSIPRIRPP